MTERMSEPDDLSIGLGTFDDGRCGVTLRVQGSDVAITMCVSPAAAKAYGEILLEAARQSERINKDQSGQPANP